MEIKSRQAEKKLKQQIGRLNDFLSFLSKSFRIERKLIKSFVQLKDLIYQHNISIYQYIPGLPLVKKINQLEPSIMLNKRYIKSIKRDTFCFDFLCSILVSISFLLYIGKER